MSVVFNEQETLHQLHHFLPSQAPLKDFVHHNSLHAFQDSNFFDSLEKAKLIFGRKTSLNVKEFRQLYQQGKIDQNILHTVVQSKFQEEEIPVWIDKLLNQATQPTTQPRIGSLRTEWKKQYKIDLDSISHFSLFRLIGAYLDQGISSTSFPITAKSFIKCIQNLEKSSFFSLFKSKRAINFLQQEHKSLEPLLEVLVGDSNYFERYLFDQQFAHPGWSGMVSFLENHPNALVDKRNISLFDFIYLELLIEIDALDRNLKKWEPLTKNIEKLPKSDLFSTPSFTEETILIQLWQEAYEWTYHDSVLKGIQTKAKQTKEVQKTTFQALFCIDDREESIRRHIEMQDPKCTTYGTPAHFGIEAEFIPQGSLLSTKICPGPIPAKHIIKESSSRKKKHQRNIHFSKASHTGFINAMITPIVGAFSIGKLTANIFNPVSSSATSVAKDHMFMGSELTVHDFEHDNSSSHLKTGFSIQEMYAIVGNELKSIGLTDEFAPLVYLFGHGGSSTNNPYYAGYNCGACSGRPSSVNSRVFANMANNLEVRELLKNDHIVIPKSTQFLGGLHDTTLDEFIIYDEDLLSEKNRDNHKKNLEIFKIALNNNAKERARQFEAIPQNQKSEVAHEQVKKRAYSLFEPRPELNHSNNCLCIVGSRNLTKDLFLDQRAFLNSYNYKKDPEGALLTNILNAVSPVCGGINLEYYFSRVDNEKLGSGTKLSHNVVGLFALNNGVEGDLRIGLPSQMIEVHDPLRLLVVVEQHPDIVLKVIQKNKSTYCWYQNEWLKLVVFNPEEDAFFVFKNNEFHPYQPVTNTILTANNWEDMIDSSRENLPVKLIKTN